MQDDGPVLGQDIPGDGPSSPVPKMWMAAGGLALVAVVIVLSSGTGTQPAPTSTTRIPTTTSTTLPDRPSVSALPTPEGEVVERTLEWESTEGFDEATRLDGIVEFEDTYWVAGSTEDGLALWTGNGRPGEGWSIASRIDRTRGWFVGDVAVVDGELVMAAAGDDREGALFSSVDGQTWRSIRLEPDDPELSRVTPLQVVPAADGVLVTGIAHAPPPPDELLAVFEPRVADLVRSGDASLLGYEEGAVIAVIDPGLEIGRVTEPEYPEGFEGLVDSVPHMWQGDRLDSLTDSGIHDSYGNMVHDDQGRVYRQRGAQITRSTDGRDWEPVGPAIPNTIGFAPWRNGLVFDVWEQGLEYWASGSNETVPLLPRQLSPVTGPAPPVTLHTGEWGLAVLHPVFDDRETEPSLTITTDQGELYLHWDLQLEFVQDEESLWKYSPFGRTAVLDDQGRIVFGRHEVPVAVEIEEWQEAMGRIGVPSGNAELIHTADGERWSATPLDEIMGSRAVASPHLLTTDDLLLLIDQSAGGPAGAAAAVIGRPLG